MSDKIIVLPMDQKKPIEVAYFSLEIMLESDIPSYAGGLGVLAGDLLRSCADMRIPAVGVSLTYSGHTYDQIISPDGSQKFDEFHWQKNDQLTKLPEKISLEIKKTKVIVGVWRYDIVGFDGFIVPVYLLDTDFFPNPDFVRSFTKHLYEGSVRLPQEIILGIGGVKMLRKLGYSDIKTFHMNEGHASFATLALLEETGYSDEKVKSMCVFTTHTPIPEGHDSFSYDFAYEYANAYLPLHIRKIAGEDALHMTDLGFNVSKFRFAVSKKHREITKNIFKRDDIASITNGVHHRTWIGPTMQNLFDEYIPEWIHDPIELKNAEKIPNQFLWDAHQEEKRLLMHYVNENLTTISGNNQPGNSDQFDENILTISQARRPVPYKRPLLLYKDLERLLSIGSGKIQIIQCGKSHPNDPSSQGFVNEVLAIAKKLEGKINICYLENYSPKIARLLVAGSDVWLNTPTRPLEASGTSGMKGAMNGIINFSVLDGWWIEGSTLNPNAGFNIGDLDETLYPQNSDDLDADAMYSTLENLIIPMYYNDRNAWIEKMKQSITLGAYFNTHRCIREYKNLAWSAK